MHSLQYSVACQAHGEEVLLPCGTGELAKAIADVGQLMDISGIGPAKFEGLKDQVQP